MPVLPAEIQSALERDADILAWVSEHLVPLDWVEVLENTPEEPDWLVPSVFLSGASYAVVASAKVGKSLLLLDIACALATGRSALGQPPRDPVTVLYIDMENTETDLADRVRDLGYSARDFRHRLPYLSFPNLSALDTPEGGRQVHAAARFFGADLVVIDTLSRVVDGDENEANTYQAFYRHAVLPLKRDGTTVVRLDHLGKDTSKGARGSSAKSDDVDAIWLLDTYVGDRLKLKRENQRSNHHPECLVIQRRLDPLCHVIAGDHPVQGSGEAKPEDLVGALEALGEATVRQLTERLFPGVEGEEFGRVRSKVHRWVGNLEGQGRVASDERLTGRPGGTEKVVRLVAQEAEK
ncbi:AAA family ATPase [Dietzia sp. B19]|nr:AAA family ATPase [Dietzia sp. B19]